MVAATQAGLEVTEDGVDPLELGQVFRLSPGDDGGLMYTAGLGDRAKQASPSEQTVLPTARLVLAHAAIALRVKPGTGESLTRKGEYGHRS
jgi:hypothetical protein